ncbi:hypothetical protein BDR04DRAFT_1208468 [Suillus decipiens]|nr:hypothetical protein BDR04DRAFT_1208468 [Suillus decipiens]
MTALGLAALAEVGIKTFNEVLKPLWLGICLHRGKGLAAFLKAIGFIIPLMDLEYASYYYTKEVTVILIHESQTSDEEMKKIILKVVQLLRVSCLNILGKTSESYPTSSGHSGFAAWRLIGGIIARLWRQLSSFRKKLGCLRSWAEL